MFGKFSDVHPEAKIGENVTVSNFSTVCENVEIGDGTWIGPNVTIFSGARIGKNCKIFPGAVIAAVPQDLKFEGEETLAKIGDNTTIRECVTINRGTKAHGETSVGSNCLIMAYAHVAHDCIIGNNVILANNATLAGHVEIGDWAIISATSAIHQFCKIGAHAILAGGSLVDKDVPPFVKAARYPISYAGVNSLGLHRRGFSQEVINEIQDIYRYVFQMGYKNSHALELIETNFGSTQERNLIIHFMKNSERGIMKGYNYLKSKEEVANKEE